MHSYQDGTTPIPSSTAVRLGSLKDAGFIIARYEDILGRRPNAEYIRQALANYPSSVAYHQDVLVGFAYCGFMAPDVLELANISLHKDYRSSGVGTELLKILETEVSKEYKALLLTNSALYGETSGKRAATNFYLRNGYQLIAGTNSTNLFWKNLG